MALELLTIALGGICALLHVECCIYKPNHKTQVQEALQEMDVEVPIIQALQQDLFTQWWESLGSIWYWIAISCTVVTRGLVVLCCSLYYCCGLLQSCHFYRPLIRDDSPLIFEVVGCRKLLRLSQSSGHEKTLPDSPEDMTLLSAQVHNKG